MKAKLLFHLQAEDDFAIVGLIDEDDPGDAGFFLARVLQPDPAPAVQPGNGPGPLNVNAFLQQQLSQAGLQVTPGQPGTAVVQPPPKPDLVEHARKPGPWYEFDGYDKQNKPQVKVVEDQATMTQFELLLLAHAEGRMHDDQAVSHLPAFLQMAQAFGAAAVAMSAFGSGQAMPPPQPDKPNTLRDLVDMLKRKPALPPPPEPPQLPEPAQPVGASNTAFDQALDDLDDFLNDAKLKAGGL